LYGRAKPDQREPIVLDLPEDTHESTRRAIIEGDYKLIASGPDQYLLFNISRDPAEEQNLLQKEPDAFVRLRQHLHGVWSSLRLVEPYGGMKLRSGRTAQGPMRPPIETSR
jgi:hypothetical protein